MNEILRDLLRPGAKIIRLSVDYGTLSDKQRNTIGLIRKELFSLATLIMGNITASNDTKSTDIVSLRNAFKLLHPKKDYSFDERVIRDLLDVCITLSYIEKGEDRKSSGKSLDAVTLLLFLE
jgi:hypothetical protein